MKILNLKFKNINSLFGENEIDFSQPAFTNEGLFAITGKTGAGKSSILDAISLALYGKTPRVDISSGDNAVMTRGENDCYAEIIFEVAGKKWKSSWKQERARTGKLKQVERVVADENDNIVADKLSIKGERKNADEKTVNEKIVEIIGLTFEQFTKAILLAQGGFAAFLQADKNEKGELLEQITGTEIYAEISKKVFERKGIELQKLERINIELEGITILSDEEIERLKTEHSTFSKEKVQFEEIISTLEMSKNLLTEIDILQHEITEIRLKTPDLEAASQLALSQFEKANTAHNNFKSEKEKQEPVFKQVRELDTKIAERTKLLQPIVDKMNQLENDANAVATLIATKQSSYDQTQKLLAEKEKWAVEHKKYEDLVSNFSAIELEIRKLEDFSLEISQQIDKNNLLNEQLESKKIVHQKINEDFEEKLEKLTLKQAAFSKQKNELAILLNGKEIVELQNDKELISTFGTELKNLLAIEKSNLRLKNELENLTASITQFEEQIKVLSDKNEKNQIVSQQLQEKIDLLTENISLTKTIQSLEEHRHNLKDDEACPLCGALEHPYALGNVPQLGEKEKELAQVKSQLAHVSGELQTVGNKLISLQSSLNHALENKKKNEKEQEENSQLKSEILSNLKEINIDFSLPEGDVVEKLEEILQQKRNELREVSSLLDQAIVVEKVITTLRDTEIPALQEAVKSAEETKNSVSMEVKLLELEFDSAQKKIAREQDEYQNQNEKIGEKLTEFGVQNRTELKRCLDLWIENKKQVDELSEQLKSFDSQLILDVQQLASIQNSIAEKMKEKEQLDAEKLQLSLQRNQLFDKESVDEEEKILKEQLKNAEEIKAIAEQRKQDSTTELEKSKAVLVAKEAELTKKMNQKNTDRTITELQLDIDEKKNQKDVFALKIGAIEQQLASNEQQLERSKEKLEEHAAQKIISDNWSNLDKLIGSADGKRYRNFAQALTFEHLIGLANNQLEKMSDRYILKRTEPKDSQKDTNPFELSVIDKFQNNEERTSKNLSGGEKFIVSLSLALGLSTMASKNMQIDTMFIDEGFGTLDSEYLDTALSTLSNLQSEGKVIGVISHLTELKERISTHIEVVSGGNGHSTIQII